MYAALSSLKEKQNINVGIKAFLKKPKAESRGCFPARGQSRGAQHEGSERKVPLMMSPRERRCIKRNGRLIPLGGASAFRPGIPTGTEVLASSWAFSTFA